MSTPPQGGGGRAGNYGSGGAMEYGQNMVIQKILNAHKLQEQERRNRHRQKHHRHQSNQSSGSSNNNNKPEQQPASTSTTTTTDNPPLHSYHKHQHSNNSASTSSPSSRGEGGADNAITERDPLLLDHDVEKGELPLTTSPITSPLTLPTAVNTEVTQSELLPENEARKVFNFLKGRKSMSSSSLRSSQHQSDYYTKNRSNPRAAGGAVAENRNSPPPLPVITSSLKRNNYSFSSTNSFKRNNHSFSSSCNSLSSMNNTSDNISQAIRFQVLVWNIGALDVVQGRVPMTFRVTIFWNDVSGLRQMMKNYNGGGPGSGGDNCSLDGDDSVSMAGQSAALPRSWVMQGRQKAVPSKDDHNYVTASASSAGGGGRPLSIDVPPVSILNVVTFDTIGAPEICLLRQDTGLWQWTCMYRATLIQEHLDVHNFPHDSHNICLKLAVLAHRKAESKWDRRYWHLGLATKKDSMGCVRIPHGLLAGELNIPEFSHERDLQFGFDAMDIGPNGVFGSSDMKERCLTVKLRVKRNSYYYDRNIVPLLGMLNLVAITITGLGADQFFERGLLTLNIAFVEVNIRMATDKHLPSVPYQIKLQRVLNEYFFGLLFLVLESNFVFELHRYGYGNITGVIDLLAACTVLTHNIWTLYDYYVISRRPK